MERFKFIELSEHADENVNSIRSYLNFLVEGDGKKAHCPFTSTMLQKRQFYYDASKELISKEEFVLALRELEAFKQKADDRYAVVGIVYANPKNYSLEIAEQGEVYRQEARLNLIAKGLTIAWTHPKNPLGTHTDRSKPDYPLWVSEVPMLMLRSLDKGDEPFMLTDEAKRAFILGMKYHESIEITHWTGKKIDHEETMRLLLGIMNDERQRLSVISSVTLHKGLEVHIWKTDGTLIETHDFYGWPSSGC